MKTLVINPYSEKLLNSLKEAYLLNLGSFILVGDKINIIEKCYKCNIESKIFTIFNITDDFEIIEFSLNLIKTNKIDNIIFGDFPVKYQYKILNLDNEKYKSIDIIDIPFLKHFLFISLYTKKNVIDYSIKMDAIIQAEKLMGILGIKQVNVALVNYYNTKVDFLENSVIDISLKKNGYKNIKIYDAFDIYTLFSFEAKVNIYTTKINLLIFNNYETTQIYLDTLKTFTSVKTASIMIGDLYGIDTRKIKNNQDLIFALSILKKMSEIKEEEAKKEEIC